MPKFKKAEAKNRVHLALDIKTKRLAMEANDEHLTIEGMASEDITTALINIFSNAPNKPSIKFISSADQQRQAYIINLIESSFSGLRELMNELNLQRDLLISRIDAISGSESEFYQEMALQELVDNVEQDLEIFTPEQIIDNMIYWHFSDMENIDLIRSLLRADLMQERPRLNSGDSVINSCLEHIYQVVGRVGDEGGFMDIANTEISRYYVTSFNDVAFDYNNTNANDNDLGGLVIDSFASAAPYFPEHYK
jgi:hypothetical protein